MTDDRMALVDLLQKSGDGDFLRAVAEAVLQILMEADFEGLIGAARHERSADRLNYRNGYRERSLDCVLVKVGGGVKCGCRRHADGTAGLRSAPEMPCGSWQLRLVPQVDVTPLQKKWSAIYSTNSSLISWTPARW